MPLGDLQARFQSFVLGGGSVPGEIAATARVPAAVRLGIYADAYGARLTEALASNYPKLSHWMGAEDFRLLAQAYRRRHPPAHFSVRWHGEHLPAFMALESPYDRQPLLAELAQWEWKLTLAFDAADDPVLRGAALTHLTPAQWPELRLALHPSVGMLELETEAPQLWRALDRGETPTENPAARTRHWAIWRKGLETRYRALDVVEAAALAVIATGHSFGEVCEAVAKQVAPDVAARTAAQLLARWLEDEMLAA